MGERKASLPIITDNTAEGVAPGLTNAYNILNTDILSNTIAYPSLNAAHYARSRLSIAATTQEALWGTSHEHERRALIVGPGACHDLPLEHIVESFDHTTLVEMDLPTTERALSVLSPRLLGRVSLIHGDITGMAQRFYGTMNEIVEACDNFKDFVPAAAETCAALRVQDAAPDIGRDYTFVCSQLVMSQLFPPSFEVLGESLKSKYGVNLSHALLPDDRLSFAFREYTGKLQAQHIKTLASVVSQSGVVQLADTYLRVSHTGGPTGPMIVSDVVESAMERHFEHVRPHEKWQWTPTPAFDFLVVSSALRRRS